MTTTETTPTDNHLPEVQGNGDEHSNDRLSPTTLDRWSSIVIRLLVAWIVIVAVLSFITVPWLKAGNDGDLTTPMIWFYHAMMLPVALLFLILCTRIFVVHPWVKFIVTHSGPIAILEGFGFLVLGYGTLHNVASLTAFGYWIIMPCTLELFAITAVFVADLAYSAFVPPKDVEVSPQMAEIRWALFFAGVSVLTWVAFGLSAAANQVGISWSFWAGWQKESYSTLMGNIITAHSHGILPAFMAGIVILAAETFGYSKLAGTRKQMARLGVGIMLGGIALFSGIYTVSALGTFTIPAWFPFGPGAVNGIAMDDTMTGLVGIGALILAGTMLPELRGSLARLGSRIQQRYNPVRAAVYLTYVTAATALFIYGYYIEMNESKFGFGSPPAARYANDQIFSRGHLLFVFGALPVMAVLLMAVEISGNISELGITLKKWISGAMASGMVITLIGLGIWVFSAPGHSKTLGAGNAGEIIYVIGQCLMLIGAIIEVFALRPAGKDEAETVSASTDAELAHAG